MAEVRIREMGSTVTDQPDGLPLRPGYQVNSWVPAIRFSGHLSESQQIAGNPMRPTRHSNWLSQARGSAFAPSFFWRRLIVFPIRGHSSTDDLRKGAPAFRLRTLAGLSLKNPGSATQSTWIGWQHAWIMCLLSFALLANLGIAQNGQQLRQDFANLSREADAARDAEDLNQAATLYQKALTFRPAWKEGWWSLGMVQYVTSHYTLCAHAFQRLTVLVPTNGSAYVMLGLCEFELDRDAQALRHIEQGESIGIHADPQLAHVVRYHEGILLQRLGEFEGAKEVLMGLCVDGEQPKPLLNGLGMIALRMPDRNPPPEGSPAADIVARLGLAMSYEAQHKLDQARQIYAQVAQQHPDYPNVHIAYGRFLSEQQDVPAANQEFEQEIKNYPDNVTARLLIASDYYRVDSATGIPYAEEAVRLAPQYPFGHYVLGLLLVDAGEYRKAIPELETARRTFPHKIPQIYFSLGVAYSHVGRKDEAARARAMFVQLKKEQEQHAATTEPSAETGTGNITPPQ
jgi:tetratricopeptide (TPR) repeat protein